ncbi:MAG: hypothetical protein P8L85_22295 [Rubripirellula sp.]|nr:hypothetical protein [Rubripirellula sp.]
MPNLIHRVRELSRQGNPPSKLVRTLAAFVVIIGFGLISSENMANGQQREGDRPTETEPRSSAEAAAGRIRSAERDAAPRRSAEAEAGPRRSAERDAAPRRSPETLQAPRERGDGVERDSRSQRGLSESLRNFKPQNQREAALLQMITQLQNEIAVLRRQTQANREGRDQSLGIRRDGNESRGQRDGFLLSPRWRTTKDGKVFSAYDKNGDEVVTLDEWLLMFNGNISPSRREMQTKRFNDADPNRDGKFVPAEFIYWYSIGRHREVEQGRRTDAREGTAPRRGPRDGDGQTRGPRDGDGQTRGPRDGDRG